MMRERSRAVSGILAAFVVAGCGMAPMTPKAPMTQRAPALAVPSVDTLEAEWSRRGSIPANFAVVAGDVMKLLPDDTQGIPHQVFVIRVMEPARGLVLEVNHNVAAGEPVARLEVGERVIVRGVLYSGFKEGIHWTHHAKRRGDAGFIQTENGRIYE
jgi:hypothetical protein